VLPGGPQLGARGLGALPMSRCDPHVIIILGVCVRGADPAALTGREANGSNVLWRYREEEGPEGLSVLLFIIMPAVHNVCNMCDQWPNFGVFDVKGMHASSAQCVQDV
jgi:hypothetical protein